MIFIILQGSRAWVSQSLPSMESLWIPEKTFGICEFPSHTSMAWLQDLQLILLLLLLWVHSQIVQFDTTSITTSNRRPCWSYGRNTCQSFLHSQRAPSHADPHKSFSSLNMCMVTPQWIIASHSPLYSDNQIHWIQSIPH